MALVARITALSLLTGLLGSGVGAALFAGQRERALASFVFACIGAITGALAGTAREIVSALRERPSA